MSRRRSLKKNLEVGTMPRGSERKKRNDITEGMQKIREAGSIERISRNEAVASTLAPKY